MDSLAGIAEAMNLLLQRLGYPQHPEEAYRYFVGDGLEQLMVRSIPEEKLPHHSLSQLVSDYRKIYQETWPLSGRPYAGIPELLDKLADRGIKTAVISNKADSFTKKMVKTLLPGRQFTAVWGQRPGIPLKPDPTSALDTAVRLEIPPGQCIFAGDTGIDMQTAVNAGMIPLGVLWGFREADELCRFGARYLIKRPEELLKYI